MKRLFFALILLSAIDASAMKLPEYRDELRRLDAELGRNDGSAARARARRLRTQSIDWNGEALQPDSVMLEAIERSKSGEELRKGRRLLAMTLKALEATTVEEKANADRGLLERLRTAESSPSLREGGAVPNVPAMEASLAEQIAKAIERGWEWFIERLDRFYDWILDFWPRRRGDGLTLGMPTNLFVTILVAAIVLLIALAAFRVLRRKGPDAPLQPVHRSTVQRGRDEDPLSREANEWERYALELTASGRIREAIRAWYHAVLVSLYRTGVVHYRKGRTNWEYVSRLGPEITWRPRFIDMTRTFEREWYGHSESSRQALDHCARDAREILAAVERQGSV